MKVLGVIHARYQSTRLPGKPLADICGKPMVWWVYQQCIKAKKLNKICVATDDKRIADVCNNYEIPIVMTEKSHLTAAHRLQEVSTKIEMDFYVQINGDEPLIDPELIDLLIPDNMPLDIEFGTNIVAKMSQPVEVLDASNIKVVFDTNMKMIYMSRIPIPYPFNTLEFEYYKHVGIIGYNKKMLDFYANTIPGHLESIEGIDTLRFIDYGKFLFCMETQKHNSLSIDTPKDLERVKKMIKMKSQ